MSIIRRNIIIVILLLCSIPALAHAQDARTLAQKVKDWEAIHTRIETSLKNNNNIEAVTLKEYRQQLRTTRQEASTEITAIKEKLNSRKDLLTALGDAPEDTTSEGKKVRDLRKKLDNEIVAIDTELKQTNLSIAKSDELLFAVEDYQSKRKKERLLTKFAMPLSPENLHSLYDEFVTSIQNFNSWFSGSIVLVVVLLLIFSAKYVTLYLNNFVKNAAGIKLISPFSQIRMLLVIVSAYFVFLLRFNIINFYEYPTLEKMVHVFASICLSTILFLALGKIKFILTENSSPDIASDNPENYNWLWNGIRRLTRIILFLLPVAALLGYVNLAQYISFNILITIASGILFFAIRNGIAELNKKLHGEDEQKKLSPLAITIIEPVIALFSVLLCLFFWGMTTEDVQTFITRYGNGFTIGDVTINFTGMFTAFGIFIGLYYTTKLVQRFLSSRVFPYTSLDTGVRDAIIAITGYIGVTVALLAAMGKLGLDMSNLAIVAGALSVGIGFGLQAIFNNFVSGLILLFERPVRVGDWVIVGNHEGIVKRIQVRSTEIETFWNSSVIVPNAQLISDTVVNWTLHDKMGRVDIAVGVAYGSDTDKVKDVLLKVAYAHPEVRSYPEARVIFNDFGDSSLNFELRCYIKNIRDVFLVRSELRFAIDKAFRENNIEIPFPQRDLHIKNPEALRNKN